MADIERRTSGTVEKRRASSKLRSNGTIEKRGNSIRARYAGPDGARYSKTFRPAPGQRLSDAKADAINWLAAELKGKQDALLEVWQSPAERREAAAEARLAVARAKEIAAAQTITLAEYAARWLTRRTPKLKPRTLSDFRGYLDRLIIPNLGHMEVKTITRAVIEQWYDRIGVSAITSQPVPRLQSQTYALLRTIMKAAVQDEIIDKTPCMIEGGASPAPKRGVTVLTAVEATALADCMPDKRLRLAVLLGARCAMREGEILALRRSDIHINTTHPERSTIAISRGVVWVHGQVIESTPKTDSSVRTMPIPPPIYPEVVHHLATYAQWGTDGLLFPSTIGGITHNRVLGKAWHRARLAVGRPEFHFHDLRGTGATWLLESGASVAEVMTWLGHTTVTAAMRYWQASSQARQITLAASLPALAPTVAPTTTATVVNLNERRTA
ncbi:MAG: site-specific integrase [Propionibacteriaceae bacterium]|jgi:integrase|nr:site-specific integrase [Propionibacteriaceae bacterium]